MTDLHFSYSTKPKKHGGAIVLFTDTKKSLCDGMKDLDSKSEGFVKHALKQAEGFQGKKHELWITSLPKSASYSLLILASLGDAKDLKEVYTAHDAETLGGKIFQVLRARKCTEATVEIEQKLLGPGEFAARLAHGMQLRSYKFEHYKEQKQDETPLEKLEVTLSGLGEKDAKALHARLDAVAQGVFFARDLVNEPPNVLYPESYAERIRKELKPLGVKVEVFDAQKLENMGMKAMLAVGQGSARPPAMVVMSWIGDEKNKKEQPLAFVGKGVTFDTGGISLKPGNGMDEMKMDMGGSAAVVGLMKALAAQKIKKNVIGIVGLVENMPSSNAYRPGDIIGSYKGKHIEVLNTDAEGRLVLVDCLTYVQEKYDPVRVVDLATLTGAIMVALGYEYSGVFVNDDEMWAEMDQAGKVTGEKLWRMPLDESYRKQVESDVADVRNLGKKDRWGGACTAASFLEHFIDEGRSWAHMDIAGTAWDKADSALSPKGANGVGVRVLEEMVTAS